MRRGRTCQTAGCTRPGTPAPAAGRVLGALRGSPCLAACPPPRASLGIPAERTGYDPQILCRGCQLTSGFQLLRGGRTASQRPCGDGGSMPPDHLARSPAMAAPPSCCRWPDQAAHRAAHPCAASQERLSQLCSLSGPRADPVAGLIAGLQAGAGRTSRADQPDLRPGRLGVRRDGHRCGDSADGGEPEEAQPCGHVRAAATGSVQIGCPAAPAALARAAPAHRLRDCCQRSCGPTRSDARELCAGR